MQDPQSECAPREAGRREYRRLTEKGGLTFDPAVLVLINPLKEFVRLHYVSLYIPPDCEERRKSIRLITKTTAWIFKSPLIVCVTAAWESVYCCFIWTLDLSYVQDYTGFNWRVRAKTVFSGERRPLIFPAADRTYLYLLNSSKFSSVYLRISSFFVVEKSLSRDTEVIMLIEAGITSSWESYTANLLMLESESKYKIGLNSFQPSPSLSFHRCVCWLI